MKHSSSTPRRILEFLGSVKMTLVLLVFGAVAMSFGTVLESRTGVDVARASVYTAAWFDFFLLLIAVNLAAAVINRIPLKRHQLSFVVVHASIILLMLGAWISRNFGYEGQLRVYEGQGSSELYLYEKEILLTGPRAQSAASERMVHRRFALPDTVFLDGLVLQEAGGGNVGVQVLDVVPNGFVNTGIASAEAGKGPGIEYVVAGQGESVNGWLLSDHPEYRRNDLGPLEVEILRFRSQDALDHRRSDIDEGAAVYVERGDDSAPLRIPLPDGIGQEVELGSGISVKVASFFEYARVVGGSLANDPSGPRNPAAVVEVATASRNEKHIVFSEFPEFSQHQVDEQGPLTSGVRLAASSASSKPLLSFLVGPGGKFFTQVSGSSGRGPVMDLPMDGKVAITGTPFSFALERFYQDAERNSEVVAAKPGQEGGRAIVQLAVTNGENSHEFWLEQGSRMPSAVAGPGMQFEFVRQTKELPFRVELKQFDIKFYPGGRRPANYSSDIAIAAIDGTKPAMASLISMNKPLDYMGFRLFQSSYVLGGGGRPDLTILSVSYDPGVPLVYASFVLLILGVGWYVLGDGKRKNGKSRKKAASDDSELKTEFVLTATDGNAESDSGRLRAMETVQ